MLQVYQRRRNIRSGTSTTAGCTGLEPETCERTDLRCMEKLESTCTTTRKCRVPFDKDEGFVKAHVTPAVREHR